MAYNTSNLHKHLTVHKLILDRVIAPKRTRISSAPVVTSRRPNCQKSLSKVEQKAIDRLLIVFLCRDYLPFVLVESPRFQQFIRRLNPYYRLPSRAAISTTLVPELYNEVTGRVSDLISAATDVCCTCDGWTSRPAEHYLGLTAHFLNGDFKMESVTIGIVKLIAQDTNGHAGAIRTILSKYAGLSQKVRLLVTDGAAVMKSTATALGYNWLHCFPHRLNLVVKDNLKLHSLKQLFD